MKKLLYPFAITFLFAVSLTFTSCEQENLEPPIEQQLIGKWSFQAAIGNYTDDGVNRRDTTWFDTNDYFEFKADGTVNILAFGVEYDGNWKITNNKLFFSNTGYVDYSRGYELPVLTQSDLNLFQTQNTPPNHYFEGTLVFKR